MMDTPGGTVPNRVLGDLGTSVYVAFAVSSPGWVAEPSIVELRLRVGELADPGVIMTSPQKLNSGRAYSVLRNNGMHAVCWS